MNSLHAALLVVSASVIVGSAAAGERGGESPYSLVGSWEKSIAANKAVLAAAKAYAAQHYPGVADASEARAYDLIEYAYLQLGEDREAKAAVREVQAIRKFNVMTPALGAAVEAVRARYALERGAWNEAVALRPVNSPFPYAEAIVYFARAVGAARVNAKRDAERDLRALHEREAACRRLRELNCAQQVAILEKAGSAWLAMARGEGANAEALMRQASDLEDASGKDGALEVPLFPVREQLAYLLLELKRPRAALKEFEAVLRHAPQRLRSYYGAAKAAQMAGNADEAAHYFRELLALTRNGDGERQELLEAKRFFGNVRTARVE